MIALASRQAALLALLFLAPSPVLADDDQKLVESVAAEVTDVVTGGSWSDGKESGFYRAVAVMSEKGEDFAAKVFLQWLAVPDDSPVPTVSKTVPVTEINERALANATIDIEGEDTKNNQIVFMVSSYDFDKDEEVVLLVRAEKPGSYKVEEAAEAKGAAPEAAPPKTSNGAGGN